MSRFKPDCGAGRNIKAAAFRNLGYAQMNINWRNWYLTSAMELDESLDMETAHKMPGQKFASPDVVKALPAGVIIESCFSSGVDMGKRLYPVLPVRLITRIKYPAREYITGVRAPVLVVHSRDDEIIPFDMGQAIFDAAPEPKSFFEVRGDHNAGFWISRESYLPAQNDFLNTVLEPAVESQVGLTYLQELP